MNYQSLNIPEAQEFELGQLFRSQGVLKPSYYQYTYMRHWLTDHGYRQKRIQGRNEYWTKEEISRPEDIEHKCIYTVKSFGIKFFPSINIDSRDKEYQMEKIMTSRGLRCRMDGLYWSYKFKRRMSLPSPLPKAHPPQHVRFPKGAFNLQDFLELNKMRRFPENFAWAKKYLQDNQIKRLHGSHRYAQRNARGILPASVTQSWQLPGPAFTTYQFQEFNNAKQPSAEEWKSAVAFLQTNGYNFDPQWKRWRKHK